MRLRYLHFIIFIWMLSGCKKNTNPVVYVPDDDPVIKTGFLQVKGDYIADSNGQYFPLEGIAFGNEVWSDNEVPTTHHSEVDFERVQAMGMNVIRFYLNYKTFEDDSNPYVYKNKGWEWIDQNVAWARKYNIYLVLNMHVPQGGYQSGGKGDALWNDVKNQDRLIALWKAIASRYKSEIQIVGYGIVNEPVPTNSITQWQNLAQGITDAIREVDQNHIVFVEKAIYVKLKPEDSNLNFPIINDDNLCYEFHIYDPLQYTHQLFEWAGQGEGGKYPDESELSYTGLNWYTATFNNPTLGLNNGGWQYLEGDLYRITDPKIKLAIPALVGAQVGSGAVYYDNLEIKEYDENGNYIKTLLVDDLTDQTGWSYWSENGTGSWAPFSDGLGNTGLSIQNASSDCNLSKYNHAFQPVMNHSYQINGRAKGENMSSLASCRFRIDFLTTDYPIYARNKLFLEAATMRYVNWAKARNKPVYMGEFGAGIHCFDSDKGGLAWVNDMIDIAQTNSIAFSYHTYHEDSFGLYLGYGSLPDPAFVNQPLIDLLTQKLR